MATQDNKLQRASIVLGLLSIASNVPGFFLLFIQYTYPDSLNLFMTWSMVALMGGLSGVLSGSIGLMLTILASNHDRGWIVSLNLAGIIFAILILLNL